MLHHNNNNESLKDLRVPIVIGVTGHRDPKGTLELAACVREIFEDLRERFPNTPLVLLSPLAEGADRLVVSVAKQLIEEHPDLYNIKIIVPLPMPIDDYAKDFVQQDSLEELSRLIDGTVSFVLPAIDPLCSDMSNRGNRDLQYSAVGAYIVQHSQVLIALWDGLPAKSSCGTSAIVKFKLEGIPEPLAPALGPLDTIETGPVYQIVTPRISSESEPENCFELRILFSENWKNDSSGDQCWDELLDRWNSHRNQSQLKYKNRIWGAVLNCFELWQKTIESISLSIRTYINKSAITKKTTIPLSLENSYYCILGQIDRFNSDILNINDLPLLIEKSKETLFTTSEQSELSNETECIFTRFAVADSLANCYRSNRRKVMLFLFLLAVTLGFVYEMYAHWLKNFEVYEYIIILYPVVFYSAYRIYRKAEQRSVQQKHLDYRALAEGVRVQLFWKIAGITDDITAHYLHQQRSEMDWICYAIRSWCMHADSGNIHDFGTSLAQKHTDTDSLELVRKCWVDDQTNYFSKNNRLRHDVLSLHEHFTKLALFLGISVSLFLTIKLALNSIALYRGIEVTSDILSMEYGLRDRLLEEIWIIVMGMSPVIAAAITGYAEKMAYSAETKQFHRMLDIFMLAANRLCHFLKEGQHDKARSLILDLGCEALKENASWVLLHRERPMELPIG